MDNLTNNKGFSLIEIMVVVVIMGILSTVFSLKIIDHIHDSKVARAKTDIQTLESALDLYRMDNGIYPTTDQGLRALIEKPEISPLPARWRKGGYLKKPQLPIDPWNNEYVYLCPGINFDYDVISRGADGEMEGEDENKDISSWEVD